MPRWTIGILSVSVRRVSLTKLLGVLTPQLNKDTEVIIYLNDGEHSIGKLRQTILDEAAGEYISFIDDDDMIPEDFVATILPYLDGVVDYIGFKVDLFDNGERKKPVYHSLAYPNWHEDDKGYYRGITHLNPLRTELARQSKFPDVSMGEDEAWTTGINAKTEVFIDRPMYTYLHETPQPITESPYIRIRRPK